uniref:GPI ethanolamine phosphate transferase 3 n=1 Tax=Anthurium amnicola TaxID=1678845 RepID=A0A1D1YWQ8_9ARAE
MTRADPPERMARRSPASARWPFAVILLLHAAAAVLFTRGFLLTRTELPFYSACSDLSASPCSTTPASCPPPSNGTSEADPGGGGGSGKCWTRPAVDRLVIIVLDALRFDFVAPSAFFDEVKPWMDKLRVLQKLASGEGSSARIFKAVADPPTTSLQRLKGLTTGGLPTFIDVGNSFGAPAIIEDNLIYQLAKNGKRILMMGDDTWLQLFPNHFAEAYPYPSFNVKDLHTVDNGCIEHLLPSLYREDWDVLIAHFLGVDHAGHIFGVDSTQMIEKLDQYNTILEKVVEVMKNQSGPGGLHENTFLVVMGDHGQTINGDHGGGTAEEVETSLFAMSLRSPPPSLSPVPDALSCKLNLDGEKICVGSIQQLDFAVTIAALLGVPFPFGSIGRVNRELYALSAGTWDRRGTNCNSFSDLEAWMRNYIDALCINCWQVKRYIDLYSSTSIIGFSSEDLHHIDEIYTQAQANWSNYMKMMHSSELNVNLDDSLATLSFFYEQVNAYSIFLKNVAELARSKWTEFDLKMMGVGFGLFLISLLFHVFSIRRVNQLCQMHYQSAANSGISFKLMIVVFLVAIRATSFLSNSYILTEGKVANFLLATTAIIDFHHSIVDGKIELEEVTFLLLTVILRFKIDLGPSKQGVASAYSGIYSLSTFGINAINSIWMAMSKVLPVICLWILAFLLYMITAGVSSMRSFKLFTIGSVINYLLIAVHWACESNLITVPRSFLNIGRTLIPQLIYVMDFGMLALLVPTQIFKWKKRSDHSETVVISSVSMLCALNSTILLLSGRQGPLAAVVSVIGAWCILRSQRMSYSNSADKTLETILRDPIPVTKWSLLAVCLFFYTGHWCAFDGLRYGAAFIGFEHFNLIRQGILLAIDTFGFSHILPIFGTPLLVALRYQYSRSNQGKDVFFLNLIQNSTMQSNPNS